MNQVDETIEAICNWIKTELGHRIEWVDNNLPEMIDSLASLVSARTMNNIGLLESGVVDGKMAADRVQGSLCDSHDDIIIHGVSITKEELETIELHQEDIGRALSDIKGIMRDDNGMLRIKYAGTGWWNYKDEEWW